MTQNQALSILKTGKSVFLTGEPGSGKSHTVRRYVKYLQDHGIDLAITASTGIAATHIHGMTIHSWSGIGINSYLGYKELEKIKNNESICKRIKSTKVLIVDEISMLSANTLDLVDIVCKTVRESEKPFGGMQVVLVGDFFQLPPVGKNEESRFAFDSVAWQELKPIVCYLTEQHRQEDQELLGLLSAIRSNSLHDTHFRSLTNCIREEIDLFEGTTKLYSHNIDVDIINNKHLDLLEDHSQSYSMETKGKKSLVQALIKGCLSPEELVIKRGAVVMFTKNNLGEGYVNGTIGKVIGFDIDSNYPIVETKSGKVVETKPAEWAVEENGKIQAVVSQIPLRLAWAITIHKSQGMSLDEAVINLEKVFEYGQGYVALSRVRSLSGIHLLGYNNHSLKVSPEVLQKDMEFRQLSGKAYLELSETSDEKLFEEYILFIKSSGGYLEKVENIPKLSKESTFDVTLGHLKDGKNIKEIAVIRELSEGTIISHLEKLVENKVLSREEIKNHLPKKLVKALPAISSAFNKEKTGKLTPVFKAFKGKYSFDELRLAKIFIAK